MDVDLNAISPGTFSERFPRLADQLRPGSVASLLAALTVREAQAGEALVAESAPSSDLFLVWEGNLDVVVRATAGERKLATVKPGSYFGEVSFFDPGPATASVITEQGCTTLWTNRARFDEFRRKDSETAAALLREVAQSLSVRLQSAVAHGHG